MIRPMSTAAMAADSNYKRNADQLGMELIGIEFKGACRRCASRDITSGTAKFGASHGPDGLREPGTR